MSNTLAVLNAALVTALRDEDEAVWDTDERDDLLLWAVDSLWPRIAREIDPTTTTVTLVAGTYFYAVPAGVEGVTMIERYTSGEEYGPLKPGTWHIFGGKIRVAHEVVDRLGGTLRLYGYGRYDTSANPLADQYVPLVLAMARAEAYRRLAGDRVKFEEWLAHNQKQNVTTAELVTLVNEADAEVQRLWQRTPRTQRRPVPARRG